MVLLLTRLKMLEGRRGLLLVAVARSTLLLFVMMNEPSSAAAKVYSLADDEDHGSMRKLNEMWTFYQPNSERLMSILATFEQVHMNNLDSKMVCVLCIILIY